MSKRNPHIISFRTSSWMLERLIKFAIDNGLYNAKDQPNLSAAVLLLVSTGFEDYRGQEGMVVAYEAARASLLEEVKRELNDVLIGISERVK